MKTLAFAVALVAALGLAAPASAGTVVAHIDLSSQRMTVKVNGKLAYNWAVSTARLRW